MKRSTKRNVVLLTVLLVMAAACGDDAGADPERLCEVSVEIEEQDDFFELPPDEARAAVAEARDLIDEMVKVAPDDVRPSVEVLADSYTPILDAFEDVDFDHEQLDESEIEALFEAAFTDETEAASDTWDEWVDANCSL